MDYASSQGRSYFPLIYVYNPDVEEMCIRDRYARLPYGSYVFRAEIYDTGRVLASVEFPFEILSPWYLSYWAVGSYIPVSYTHLLMK